MTDLRHAYWLASRGAQQMDLANRFAAEARARELRVLALKGIAIADELYGGVHHRPMADIDFLVVDISRFEAAADLARSLGLLETGGSDHALVFKEPASGVVLELHIALTTCPGLFTLDREAMWERRAPVASSSMSRLADPDLIVHFSLHTAFQHGFVANEFHARDFVRALQVLRPCPETVLARAMEWGASKALGAMAVACGREESCSSDVASWLDRFEPHCPENVRLYLHGQSRTPRPTGLLALARVRYALAPSKGVFLRQSLLPRALPGRTTPRPGATARFAELMRASLPARVGYRT